MQRRHIESLLVGHVSLLPVRIAGDLEFLLRHRVAEMRETDRQARHSVSDLHATVVNRGDVLKGPGVYLRSAILHAQQTGRPRRSAGNRPAKRWTTERRCAKAVFMTLAVGRERRKVTVVVVQRVVIGLRDVDHAAMRISVFVGDLQRDGRTGLLQGRTVGIAHCNDEVLGFDNLAVDDLEPETELARLAVVLQHDETANLLQDRVRHYDLEVGRRGRCRLPQSFACFDACDVLDYLRIAGKRHLARVMHNQRG